MASQITGISIDCLIACSSYEQREAHSSALLEPTYSSCKGPVMRKAHILGIFYRKINERICVVIDLKVYNYKKAVLDMSLLCSFYMMNDKKSMDWFGLSLTK